MNARKEIDNLAINNPTLSEVYYGTGERKLRRRKQIKQQTLIERKKQNQVNTNTCSI